MRQSWRRPGGYSRNVHIQAEFELTACSQCSMQTTYLAPSGGAWPAAEGKIFSSLLGTEEVTFRLWWQLGSLGQSHVETLGRRPVMAAKTDRSWDTWPWGEAKGDTVRQVNKGLYDHMEGKWWWWWWWGYVLCWCQTIPQGATATNCWGCSHRASGKNKIVRKMEHDWTGHLGRTCHHHPWRCPRLSWA